MLTLSKRAEQLAKLAADRSGETPEAVVERALERVVDAPRTAHRRVDPKQIQAILARAAALPVLDQRPADDIIGYDEIGVPK